MYYLKFSVKILNFTFPDLSGINNGLLMEEAIPHFNNSKFRKLFFITQSLIMHMKIILHQLEIHIESKMAILEP